MHVNITESLGHQPWKGLHVVVEENRASVNFELVERLAKREEREWTYFDRLATSGEKKLRDPQDVVIEADHLRMELKKRRAQRGNSATIAHCTRRVAHLTSPVRLSYTKPAAGILGLCG